MFTGSPDGVWEHVSRLRDAGWLYVTLGYSSVGVVLEKAMPGLMFPVIVGNLRC